MNTSDKTREKLVESMRKTKAGTAGKTPARSKSTGRTRAVKKPAAKAPVGVDPYQRGRRVWPD
jgi:hypothetical protein